MLELLCIKIYKPCIIFVSLFLVQTMPARFMNQFGGEISESIDIESPDGSVYVVKGTKYMNKMLPQCGWRAFVDAHRIEENDSLLFLMDVRKSFPAMRSESVLVTSKNETQTVLMFQIGPMSSEKSL